MEKIIKTKKNEISINVENAVKKWNPIFEALEITDKKVVEFGSIYAEYYSMLTNERVSVGFGDMLNNLLPLNLKVISLLNLTNKNIEIKEGLKTQLVKTVMTKMQYDEICSGSGMEAAIKMEKDVVDLLANEINKQLKDKDTLYVQALINELSLVCDDNFNPVMIITSRFEVA